MRGIKVVIKYYHIFLNITGAIIKGTKLMKTGTNIMIAKHSPRSFKRAATTSNNDTLNQSHHEQV